MPLSRSSPCRASAGAIAERAAAISGAGMCLSLEKIMQRAFPAASTEEHIHSY
jgi:hypothetical protein